MRMTKQFSHITKIIPWLLIFATLFITAFSNNPTRTTAAMPAALPNVGATTVDAQVGTLIAGTPGSATYLVTVTSADVNAFDAGLSVTGLPAGATASFDVNPLSWTAGLSGTTQSATLTITTDGTAVAGTTSFTVTAKVVNSGSSVLPGSGVLPDEASATGTLTIDPVQPQTITFNPLPDKTYADLDFTIVATATSGLSVSFASAGDCSVTGDLVHIIPPGTMVGSLLLPVTGSCTITASQAGDAAYSPAPDVAQTFAITKANQTITFNPIPDQTFGTLNFTVAATATSGLTTTFTAANNCTVTGNLVYLTGLGTCTIGANQAGNAIYNAAPVVSQTFAINAAQTDLAVTKTVDNATPFDGDTVKFTIDVANNGPQNSVGITVTDLLPAGLSFVSDDGAGAYDSLTGEWLISTLSAGASATLNITATVDLNTDGNTITNTATVDSIGIDTNLLNNTADAVLNVRINDLCATTGTITLPDATTVPIWGYAPGDCSQNIPATLPGPTLFATAGDTVNITLHNGLTMPTAMLFKGQTMIPDITGIAPGGSKAYSFVASEPGTFLYEAGGLLPNAQAQIPMGMYGGLIVRPVATNQAYNDATTAFDDEALLILSDIDPALNTSADPTTFDLRDFAPKYYLINGKAYPDTDNIPTVAGNTVLLRYINAAMKPYSMATLGIYQTAIAMDGSMYTHSRQAFAETIAPGQTADTLVNIPASALDGTKYPLYNSNLFFNNNAASTAGGFGGMMTFLTVTGNAPAGDIVGPEVSTLTANANTVDATINDAGRGDSTITAAEYFVDGTGAAGTGTAMAIGATGVTVSASGTFTPPLAGSHTIYVHGQDSAGNWGPFRSVRIVADGVGPLTSGLYLSHNPNNGSTAMTLLGTADDRPNGNNTVLAAQYRIDGGAQVAMTVSPFGGKIVNLSAIIPTSTLVPLPQGVHTLEVRAVDSQNNWGAWTAIDLVIDKTGPNTSNVAASPDPNNGRKPINATIYAVRVRADFADANHNVVAAEAFIDAVGTDGTGVIFMPSDGLFNTPNESGYADIPLTTVYLLSNGTHTLYVHSKDEAGNWGPVSSTTLFVDKVAPTVTGLTASPNPTLGAATVTLAASANDDATGVVAAEWFVGADPGLGNATPMSITGAGPYNLSATVDVSTWANADYLLYVRAQDGAGNWNIVESTTLTVNTPPPPIVIPTLNFSTLGSTPLIPGLPGSVDNADIYNWDGTNFSHQVSAVGLGMPGFVNVDGLKFISPNDFYISLTGNWNIPGVGIAHDEDIIHYGTGTWSIYANMTEAGLTRAAHDIDAFDIVGGVLYFSTRGNRNPPGVTGTPDNADIYAWDGTFFTRVWDATANGVPAGANVDGLKFIDATHFYLSFSNGNTRLTGITGRAQDEDVVYYNAGNWSMYFDGTANGLGFDSRKDIDAIDLP